MACVNNERGGALLIYVIMIALVMAIAAPSLLRMMYGSELSETSHHHQKLADNLAVSAMDALFAYLGEYDENGNVSRADYLRNFPGFAQNAIELATPEGIPVEFSMQLQEPQGASTEYVVTVTAKAAEGPVQRVKTIEFAFEPSDGSSGEDQGDIWITTDDSEREEVLPGNHSFYVGGNYDQAKNHIENISEEAVKNNSEIQNAIAEAINTYKKNAADLYNSYISDIYDLFNIPDTSDQILNEIVKNCDPAAKGGQCLDRNNWTQIVSEIQGPTALRLPPGPYSGRDFRNLTFGSPCHPVYIFFDSSPNFWQSPDNITVYGAVIFRNGYNNTAAMNLTVYGDVIVNGNYQPNQSHSITVMNLDGLQKNCQDVKYAKGGNFYVLGQFSLSNNINLSAEGNFYANEITIHSSPNNFSVGGKMVVENKIYFMSQNSQIVTGQDLLAGSYEINAKNNRIESHGDILIAGDVIVRNSITWTAGGNIAIGGNYNNQNYHALNVHFQTGTTSLITGGSSGGSGQPGGSSGGSGSGGGGWNPERRK